jgi:putative membrane protein
MIFIINWLIATLAIAITAYLLPGVSVDSLFAAMIAALVLGLVNAFLRPILFILTLPITIVTLGLFTLVINASLIMLTDLVVPGFMVANFWWAILCSIILWAINFALSSIKKDL